MNYVLYRLADGALLATGYCINLAQVSGLANATTGVLVGTGTEDPTQQYVVGGLIASRPACPVTSSVSGRVVTLHGLPVGSVGQISGDATLTVNNADVSGTNVLTFPNAGTYQITVGCFPALDYSGSFTLL